ncbi:MAG: hypothetical protein A2Y80_09650, partial [Deltaproteobacteria bacterium RBG_13_58_19]
MQPLDIQIKGRQLEILPEWREKIAEELAGVQKHAYDPILHARVEIIATRHHRQGAFEIHLVTTMAGDTITVTRQGEQVLPLIVEAFNVLDRRLREHSQVRQQKVKVHEELARQGRIVRVFPDEDYGFLEGAQGLEVYFHANALKKGHFANLTPGMKVEF